LLLFTCDDEQQVRQTSMKSLIQPIWQAWRSHPVAAKMVSFATIGVANTAIDFAIFTLAYTKLGLPLIASNILSWLIAVSGSYVMNTQVTFRAETGRVMRRRDYLRFVASGVVGVVAATATLVVLSAYVPVLTAKLLSIGVGFAVNFGMSHFVVFRPAAPPPDSSISAP
jgi:putative flippase GtrA